MSFFRTTVLSITIIFILAGCSSVPEQNDQEISDKPAVSDQSEVLDARKDLNPQKELSPGGPQFSAGITYYEDGKYALAEKNLKDALSMGLTDIGDKVTAHKYLAFLYCASSRKTLCRKEFKNAFELDPNFALSPAEEGHPMWKTIYRQVKGQMKPAKKSP